MTRGPIIQANALVFLRARSMTAGGRNHEAEERQIASQRELCHRAAEQIGACVVKEYVEYGGTGPIARRPMLRQMLGDLSTFLGVRYVLVASLDRLARMPADAAAIQEAVQMAGAHILSAADLPRTYLCDPREAAFGPALGDDQPSRTKGGPR